MLLIVLALCSGGHLCPALEGSWACPSGSKMVPRPDTQPPSIPVSTALHPAQQTLPPCWPPGSVPARALMHGAPCSTPAAGPICSLPGGPELHPFSPAAPHRACFYLYCIISSFCLKFSVLEFCYFEQQNMFGFGLGVHDGASGGFLSVGGFTISSHICPDQGSPATQHSSGKSTRSPASRAEP